MKRTLQLGVCLLASLAPAVLAQTPPTVTSLAPSSLPMGSPTQNITVNGTGFDSCAVVRWNGVDLGQQVLLSATQMRAQVSASMLASAGNATITVFRFTRVVTGPTAFCLTTGQSSNGLTFTITAPPPSITNSSPLPNGTLGQSYSVQLNATGGTPPYAFNWVGAPLLPPGLNLSPRGLISGTPGQAGSFTFRVTVSDCDGLPRTSCTQQSASATFAITVGLPPPPVITTSSPLPNANIGTSYSQQLQAAGGVPPYVYSTTGFSTSGMVFPPGLNLSPSGLISGSATQPGTYNFNVTVTDCGTAPASGCSPQQATKTFSILVPAVLSLTTDSPLPAGIPGQSYAAQIRAAGGVPGYLYTVAPGSSPPPGLSLSPAGLLSGTPSSAGSFSFTIRAVDCVGTASPPCAVQTASKTFTLVIQAPFSITTASLSPATACQNYSQALATSGGTAPYTWSATGLPAGLAIHPGTGVISGVASGATTAQVTVSVSDVQQQQANRNYTLTVSASQFQITTTSLPNGRTGAVYPAATLQASGGAQPYNWNATTQLPPGLSLAPASGTISGTPTQAGSFTPAFRVTDANSCSASQVLSILIDPPALDITTAALNAGVVGQPYTQVMQAAGGAPPYNWSAAGLGAGLQINASTGMLSGTPSQAGTFAVTVTVTDSGQRTANRGYSLTVTSTLTITTGNLTGGRVGQPYDQPLSAQGGSGALVWTALGLPAGLAIDTATGRITGTPGVSGDFNVNVQVRDAGGASTSRSYTLSITSLPAIITDSVLPQGTVGVAYDITFSGSGGAAPLRFSALTALPPGLALDAFGRMSGIPAQAGLFQFTVQVTDGAGATASKTFQLPVVAAFRIITDTLPSGLVNQPYNTALTASGGTAPVTWSLESGSLPQGLNLNAGGILSGTPQQPGSFQVDVRAADAAQRTDTRTYSMTIQGAFRITTATLAVGTVGVPYSQLIGTSGGMGPFTWTISTGTLPEGLNLGAGSGLVSGMPSRAGRFPFTVSTRDSANQTTQQNYVVDIAERLSITTVSLPDGVVGVGYSANLAAAGGEAPYVWTATGALADGVTLNGGTGVLSGTPTRAGTFDFAVLVRDRAGQTANRSYRITVGSGLTITTESLPGAVAGVAYSANVAAAGGEAPYAWTVTGALPDGVTLNGGTGVLSGTPTRAGTFDFAVLVRDRAGQTANRSYRITVGSGLTLTTESLPGAVAGVAYSANVAAAGGEAPYAWAVTGALPDGVTLNGGTGVLSGTPTRAGTFDFAVLVRDRAGQTANRSYRITVGSGLTITTESLPGAVAGVAYSANIVAAGGEAPYAWTATGALPDGVTLNGGTGVLSGTPTRAGTFDFAVLVRDRNNLTASKTFRITVDSSLTISTTALPSGSVGMEYMTAVEARGGTAVRTWSASGLPQGLSIAPATGVIRGIPSRAGDFMVTVGVRDSQSVSASVNLALRIAALEISRGTIAIDNPQVGQQSGVRLVLSEAARVELRGELRVRFASDVGVNNPQVSLSTGQSANFRIPAGQTNAQFDQGTVTLQIGTVAGAITLTASLMANNIDVTPEPAPATMVRVERAAPAITTLAARREGNRLLIDVTGFATGREVASADVQFQSAPGSSVGNTTFTIPLASSFTAYYQNPNSIPFGSAFLLTLPFDVSGNASLFTGVTLTLVNAQGRSQSRTASFP